MIKNFKLDYDKENDSLFLYDPKQKSKSSIEIDNIIIDYSSKKNISAIEVLDASKLFKELMPDSILNKNKLDKISSCKIEIISRNNSFIIKLLLKFDSKEELVAPMIIPSIKERSPALEA